MADDQGVHPLALRSQHGFTLIEVLAAMTVLLVGAVSAVTLIERANATTLTTSAREAGTNLAREVSENSRSISFEKLAPGTLETALQGGAPAMGDASPAAGWQVRRRNVLYTVTPTVCSMDDARDGAGARDAGSFCTDSAPLTAVDPVTNAADRSPEDYKRVQVTVSWVQRGVARSVRQTAVVNNPGSAGGPAVRTLDLIGYDADDWVSTSEPLEFELTTSSPPFTLHWLLDGASQAPVTSGSGLSWQFIWDLGPVDNPAGVSDGNYLVGAEGFDRYGVAGPSRSLTVTINRSDPDAVGGFIGGRSTDPANPDRKLVELEWIPVAERDVIGYVVEREELDGTTTVICARQTATQCRDVDPPDRDTVRYFVWALDYASPGVERRGPRTEYTVTRTNRAPNEPTGLTLSRNAAGDVVLTWAAPAPADPDEGDSIDFYRVYRDGRSIDDRYARWDDDAQSITFVDGVTDGQAHTYYVSAVDTHHAESRLQGPVSG